MCEIFGVSKLTVKKYVTSDRTVTRLNVMHVHTAGIVLALVTTQYGH
jgi:hypothetical protein